MAIARWETFFKKAGIPNGPASKYAEIFTDNRMRMDMLNELNKEILGDLGINVMGDVIAILRHSKKVYAEISRSAANEFNVDGAKGTAAEKKKRFYPQKSPAQERISPPTAPVRGKSRSPIGSPVAKSPQDRDGKATSTAVAPKLGTNWNKKRNEKTLSSRFSEFNSTPAKKSRESNEVITVSVPIDKPPMTRKIPDRSRPLESKEATISVKKTVFDRLGSISLEIVSKDGKTSTSSTQSQTNSEMNTSSVFSRLGESNMQVNRSRPLRLHARGISEPSLAVSMDEDDFPSVLRNTRHTARPVEHVRPFPRKPLAMDLEESSQMNKPKRKMSTDEKGRSSQTTQGPEKSVFSRLGSR